MAISIEPSRQWDGNNGPWSSFTIQIGEPPQPIVVLPATSKPNIWAVLPDLCNSTRAAGDCNAIRGGTYNPNESRNFSRVRGDYPYNQLPFAPELPLYYSGTAEFGTDAVILGPPHINGEEVEHQAIAAFAYTSPWLALGLFGLSNQTLYILNGTDNHTSPLSSLHASGEIPSLFWAYNAGARYREPVAYASLTLGGYDSVRGNISENALKVPMSQDPSRDLVVSIYGIGVEGGEQQPQDPPFTAYIDSVVPELWLPISACKLFEDAFDLEWNATAQMYLLDDDKRSRLYDAVVTFTLAAPDDGSTLLKLSFPGAAFDLTARYPLAGITDESELHYFPLKRANSTSQYLLGHTFLQEAYLAVDYDRSEFYLSQAGLVSGAGHSNITTVYPPEQSPTEVVAPQARGLGPGAIAGIAIAAVVIALSLIAGAVWFVCRPTWKKRRNARFRARIEAENAGLPTTQLSPGPGNEMQEYYAKRPFSPDSDDHKGELDAVTTARGSVGSRAELESPGHSSMGSPRKAHSRKGSYGFPTSPAELESRSPRMMHSRTASGSSIEPMSPLSGTRSPLQRHDEEVHELP